MTLYVHSMPSMFCSSNWATPNMLALTTEHVKNCNSTEIYFCIKCPVLPSNWKGHTQCLLLCNWPSLSDDPTGTTRALAWGCCCWCLCLCCLCWCGLDLALPSGAREPCTLPGTGPWTDVAAAAADERNIELLSPALMELFRCSMVASVNTNWNACCSIVQISSASAWKKEKKQRF